MRQHWVTINPGNGLSCDHSWDYIKTISRPRQTEQDPAWTFVTFWSCSGCRFIESVAHEFAIGDPNFEPGWHELVS